MFTSTVVPFAHIEDTDVTTWVHAFAVNAVGANNVLRAALPHLSENGVVRVGIGRPAETEILRGADRDLLSLLFRSWVEHGQLPAQMSTLNDVANTLVSLVITAHANPSVVPEIGQLSPRIRTTN